MAAIGACGGEPDPSYYLFTNHATEQSTVPREPSAGPDAWSGGPQIPLNEVGRIGFARLLGDTLVGVFDTFACQVHLLRLEPDSVETVARVGRCGDGPGEIRGADDMVLVGDTLVLADHEMARLRFHSLADGGSRDIHVDAGGTDGWRPLGILDVSDREIWLNGSLEPVTRSENGLIRKVARDDGRLLASAVEEPVAARRNDAPLMRQVFTCHLPRPGRILVANRWRPERALLSMDLELTSGPFVSDLDWVSDIAMGDDRPGTRPSAFVRVACGADRALLQWRTLADASTIDRYYLEVRSGDDFGIEYQEHGRGPDLEHPSAYTVVGPFGGGWLVYTNQSDKGPILRIFRRR